MAESLLFPALGSFFGLCMFLQKCEVFSYEEPTDVGP